MKHLFDVEIAEKIGVNAAILFENFAYWIEKNEANEENYFDGHYWTYNSRKAFEQLFPYMSKKQIENAIKKLIDEGLIITGNYNKSTYDRTLWYALSQKGKCIISKGEMQYTKKGKCIVPKGEMDFPKRGNGLSQKGKSYIMNTNINTDINTDTKENAAEKEAEYLFERLWAEYPLKRGKADVDGENKLEILKIGYERFSKAIKVYDESVDDKKYLMHGSRFFKKGYIDYLDMEPTKRREKESEQKTYNLEIAEELFNQDD